MIYKTYGREDEDSGLANMAVLFKPSEFVYKPYIDEAVQAGLVLGKQYTVKRITATTSRTSYTLEGFEHRTFNSILFETI